MNPFLNPFVSIPFIKKYFLVPSRLARYNPQQLKKYQNKAFKKIVKYAYNVPLYHDKYKKAGIQPNDIKGIEDITKLPFITKKDLVDNFPDKIIPIHHNKKRTYVICTGGTTGKPVSIYTDFSIMSQAVFPTFRMMKFFNLNWRKSKFAHIGNFTPNRADLVDQKKFQTYVKSFFSLKNFLNMDVNIPIDELVKILNDFKPDVIMTYPAIFQHLASLKRKGLGENINPKLLWVGGSILDDYSRKYVEGAFNCKMLNIYQSVEAGAIMAFECFEYKWHIHSDYFYLETIDEQNELVSPGERGHIVVTRLWGNGTPIIRYTGMDDWVRLSPEEKCCCGLRTPTIIGGVEGRSRANIILPNGRVFPPGAFCFITPVLLKLKTFKVKQYQIVQKKIDEIDILLVIDEDLRDTGASVEEISKNIKEIYVKKVGPDVTINVKEVNEIKKEKDSSKPPSIVISYVKPEEGYKLLTGEN